MKPLPVSHQTFADDLEDEEIGEIETFLRHAMDKNAADMLIANPAMSEDAEDQLAEIVRETEQALDARVGLLVRDSGSDWSWGNRTGERFLMNSTLKVPQCGAILAQKEAGAIDLKEELPVRREDMVEYAR